MFKIILLFLSLCISVYSNGQNLEWRYSVGLSFSFGTEVNRIGLHTGIYLNYEFSQANFVTNGYYNLRSLGLKQKNFELQMGGGLICGFGRKDTIYNNFVGLLENNTFHDYGAGVAYQHYWDGQGTTQSTGMIGVNALNFSFITENDLFGNLIRQTDQYRTGAFLLEYQYLNTKYGLNTLLWTQDYSQCTVVNNDQTEEWARFGYYKDDDVSIRSESIGVFSIQVRQWLPFNQQAELRMGVNSEKVRNAVQNKFIHNQPFLPTTWIKRKPAHIPMITINNEQYIHDPTQVVRPANFYFNLSLNSNYFY